MIPVKKNIHSIQEYLFFEDQSEKKYEFENGTFIEMPGASFIHNLIETNLATTLKLHLKEKSPKLFVLGSNIKIHIAAVNTIRYPDALVIGEKVEFLEGRTDVLLNPILIAEILSPSTERIDRGLKFEEYKMIPSLKEYVLIHQDQPLVSTYFREEESLWRIQSTFGSDSAVQFQSVGCVLQLAEIYENIKFT